MIVLLVVEVMLTLGFVYGMDERDQDLQDFFWGIVTKM